MSTKKTSKAWLENAYGLATPQDNRAYYRDFAGAYDAEFAQALGYCYPRIIAEAYLEQASGVDVPIADIGCGTGLVAEALPRTAIIDGFDISAEMLRSAERKQLYRAVFERDITASLEGMEARYGALVSAGTFTHGHLGPEPLVPLMDMAKKDALCVIGVNEAHFQAMDFAQTLDRMVSDGLISVPQITKAPIYDQAGHAHSSDQALVLSFRKRS